VANVAKEYCNWLDHGRVMPRPRPFPEMVDGKDVLDLGCGLGRWLWEFQRTARSATGIEMQPEFIALGETLARREGRAVPVIHRGSAEEVEAWIGPASMDLVFSRLMFSYVPIRKTLTAVATRLRPGGILWVQVDTFGVCLRNLWRERRLRSAALQAFALCNSLLLMTAGVQLAVRTRGRMHVRHHAAHPGLAWWRRAVRQAGLADFHAVADGPDCLVFWARRPHTESSSEVVV
jgi:SAM-dependent methyltransferase